MDDYTASTYGDRIADRYDDWPGLPGDAEDAAAFLAELAGGERRALELGIGTGRVALPLAGRGVQLHGIDASQAMVSKLRGKPGGDRIPVVLSEFTELDVDGVFDLVYVVFNTFFALLTQEDQIRCFQSVATHLAPDGAFVMQAFVPDVTRFDRGQRTEVTKIATDGVQLDVARYDRSGQRVDAEHVVVTDDGIRLYPVSLRFAYPSELDLMARLAGMRLRERWSDWRRTPFDAASDGHVSVYEPA